MSNIEVGEYIRTKTGNITKIVAIKDTLVWTDDFIDVHCRYNEGIVEKMDIVKNSKSIIDLIEVGDYVNGNIVYELLDDEIELLAGKIKKKRLHFITGHLIDEEEIKSIVTKEQFKEMEYRVDE